jgi:RNA polymerase sigma-70 factor (ECF subfamily)
MAPPDHLIDELVPAAVADEPRARDTLLAELLPMVQRYCRARLGHRETPLGSADDIAQDVCLTVVRALPHYEVRGVPFRAFVFGIAAHRITDAHRAARRERADPVAEPPETASATGGPEARLLEREQSRQLDGLLQTLAPHQREILVLRVAVGLSSEETAVATGSTPGAVRVTQHRALDRLRRHLGAGDADAPDTPGGGRAGAGPEHARRRTAA